MSSQVGPVQHGGLFSKLALSHAKECKNSDCCTVELIERIMAHGDHPNQDPVDFSDLENFVRDPDTSEDETEDEEEEEGFLFESGDEITEDIFYYYVAEQNCEDLQKENEAITKQHDEIAARAEAIEEERQELRRAIKRKLEQREELATKRLRVALVIAHEARNVAIPLFEGDETGSDREAPEEVVAAVENFELATEHARQCLDGLRLIQDQMDDV